MILSKQEDVYRLYTNIIPFYIRNLSILEFWYLWGVREPIFPDPWGTRDDCIYLCDCHPNTDIETSLVPPSSQFPPLKNNQYSDFYHHKLVFSFI